VEAKDFPITVLALFATALAGCATLPQGAATDATREESVYFETKSGGYQKSVTLMNQPADRRNIFFTRSKDGERVLVCAEQPAGMSASAPGTASGTSAELDLIKVALFQNCLARANGFIDREEYSKRHTSLIDAVSSFVGAIPRR
jgi:hypothetical protein